MLRISKKERKQLYNLNYRVKIRQNQMLQVFGFRPEMQTISPSKFLTRMEVNTYKKEMRQYLSETKYTMGGIKKGTHRYFYAIPQNIDREMRKARSIQNTHAKYMSDQASRIQYQKFGNLQDMTTLQHINVVRDKNTLRERGREFRKIEIDYSKLDEKSKLDRYSYGLKTFHNPAGYRKLNNQAKINFIQALRNTFGYTNTKQIADAIEMLTGEEFALLFQSDDAMDFYYVYGGDNVVKQLTNISNAILQFYNQYLSKKKKFQQKAKYEKIKNLLEVSKIDEVNIIADHVTHYRTFYHQGVWYRKLFNSREMEDFDERMKKKQPITENDLKNARVIGYGNIKPKGF